MIDLLMYDGMLELLSLGFAVSGAINIGVVDGSTNIAGDVTGETDLDLAIPELWSSAIFGYFEKALILRGICDDYSSLVKGKGDAINIPEIPEVTGATDKAEGTMVIYGDETLVDTNILVNKHKYVAKMFEDMGVIQSNELLFSKYAQAMGYQLAKLIDTDIMTELSDLGTTYQLATADNTLTMADAEAVVGTMLTNNLDLNDCVWLLNPPTYADLLAQGMLSNSFSAVGGIDFNSPTAGGTVPTFFGMPVMQTSLIVQTGTTNHQIGYCVKKGAVGLAVQQDIRIQSEYSVDFLATKVVADVIYGCQKMTANKVMGVEILQSAS